MTEETALQLVKTLENLLKAIQAQGHLIDEIKESLGKLERAIVNRPH